MITVRQKDLIERIPADENFYENTGYLMLQDQAERFLSSQRSKIVAFWRIFEIGNKQLELWSLRVDKHHRGRKIWLFICQELIKDRKADNEVFLATKKILRLYYQKLWFKIMA